MVDASDTFSSPSSSFSSTLLVVPAAEVGAAGDESDVGRAVDEASNSSSSSSSESVPPTALSLR